MAKIHTLKISNYRGIKNFEQVFGMTDFVCLIGRGDSGKTTILQAISAVLSPNWNYSFYDTDFHNGNIDEPIEIEACLYNLPPELLSETKYGLHKRLLNSSEQIIDDLSDEDSNDNVDIITIRLQVTKDLEPKWYVVNKRENQDSVEIRTNDRAKLNVFLVSDYLDRHFSWSKGNPLYSLLKQEVSNEEKSNVIIDAIREAKEKVDEYSFNHLDKVVKKVETTASGLGLDLSNTTTTIDFRDISIREGKICLHDDKVPFRQKGKGSKRLLSIAIQTELAKSGGIVLIDEIEQGLEPDRARFLVNKLKSRKYGQVFITTHSSNVLVELNAKDIFLMKNNADKLVGFDEQFQGCLRNNPEAFFTKKILLCEGATEVGICKALNNYRASISKDNFAVMGIGIVNGTGSNFVNYCKNFKEAGFDVCVFCDSDDDAINNKKTELIALRIEVVDCEGGNAIEQQLFYDLPWEAVQQLINYAIEEKSEQIVKTLIENQYIDSLPDNWFNNDNSKIREALGKASALRKEKKSGEVIHKGWFKRIDHGEFIGKVWFNSLREITDKKLFSQFENLSNWIDNV